MNNPGYFSDQDDQQHWFFFNPCGPLPSSVTCASGSGTSNPNALQYYGSDPNPQPPFSDSCGYLGSFDTQVCQGFGANQLQCNYQGGTSGRKVSYIFNAAPTVGMPVPSETNYPQYQVVFSGPLTGGGGGDVPGASGLSGGSLFLILLLGVAVPIYLGGGYFYNFKYTEKRGIEAVPQIEYWRQLPGLVKDGCLFSYAETKKFIEKLREKAAEARGNKTDPALKQALADDTGEAATPYEENKA